MQNEFMKVQSYCFNYKFYSVVRTECIKASTVMVFPGMMGTFVFSAAVSKAATVEAVQKLKVMSFTFYSTSFSNIFKRIVKIVGNYL